MDNGKNRASMSDAQDTPTNSPTAGRRIFAGIAEHVHASLSPAELAELLRWADLIRSDADPERTCLGCRETMAAPDVSDGEEATPLCSGCAYRALGELAMGAERLAGELTRLRPTVAMDREALGRMAWEVEPASAFSPTWEDVAEPIHERYCRIGEHLFAIGYRSRQAEVDGLREEKASKSKASGLP